MGNREDLLVGAKRCLYEKGYSRTTARDIAAASGVSLSAIGYHYGTKEALLNAALYQALEEWGDDLADILNAEAGPDATPADRFEAAWEGVIASFAANRPLWAIQFELIAHIDQLPELRRTFSEAGRQARLGLAELFGSLGLAGDGERVALGSFYQALLSGVVAQWLVDPEGAPSGHDLLGAVRTVAAIVGPGARPDPEVSPEKS
ncbi:AcrR family transcriptional regulator [Streptosporangium album]|uniref:AcrR family transcriptional regulator n=1 Tax=Streptosporangium album TaxID=47479 RepID=A0A7W7WAU9_9ACTN|nr:TetR/AcrR family transcriptional regulator [Streptosporangium album]MBB4939524.1 AcrR family transcriptional regulator [Streptosporangium album]